MVARVSMARSSSKRASISSPLAEPDVAEVLQHRRQGRGREDRIDAGAEARGLGAADLPGDAGDRLGPDLQPPAEELTGDRHRRPMSRCGATMRVISSGSWPSWPGRL